MAELSKADRELIEKTGPVSCDEAEQIEKRFRASHFSNHRDMGEHARISIPVDFKRDDDVRLVSFIAQARRQQDAVERACAKLDEYGARFAKDGFLHAALALEGVIKILRCEEAAGVMEGGHG